MQPMAIAKKSKSASARKPSLKIQDSRTVLRKIIREARRFPALRRRARAPEGWALELHLVNTPAMKRLNHQYRGKNYATDVLSFPSPEVFRFRGVLGELVICGPVLRRQAREQGHSERRELRILLVHGLLHLLGFDHEAGGKQAAEMAHWEAKLLAKIPQGLIARSA